MNDFAVLVAQHLKLDMPGTLDEFLGVNIGIAKRGLRFAACRFVHRKQLFLLANHTHAATAAAGHSLEDKWIANLGGFFGELLLAFNNTLAARDCRQTCGANFSARAILLAHNLD